MKKVVLVLFSMVLILAACSNSSAGVVTGGSTSVEPLMTEMIKDYNAENPDKTPITYDSTGSSAGVEGALNGNYDVGTASREIKDSEKEKSKELKIDVLAYDGIALIVNPNNEVEDLTMEQVKDIYTGKITNWKDVGGVDGEIAVISRDSASGTRGAFEEIVGFEGGLVKSAQESSSNGEVLTNVSSNKFAIGYVSFDTLNSTVKTVSIDGIKPTVENVLSNNYKISRPFNMVYLDSNTKEEAKNFIAWVKENKADYVEKLGLIGV